MKPFENPELISKRQEGWSVGRLSEYFRRGNTTVWNWIQQAVDAGLLDRENLFRRWSDEEIEKLRQMHAKNSSIKAMQSRFDRSERAIESKLRELGMVPKRVSRWTPEMDEIVRDGYAKAEAVEYIASRCGPGFTGNSVAGRAMRLGLSKLPAPYPTERKKVWVDKSKIKTAHLHSPEVRAKATDTRRKNAGKLPLTRKKAEKVPDSFIPEGARPWLTRKFGECCYPYGERGNVHSCCKPVWLTSVMCEEHSGLCYEERRGKAA